MTNNSANITLDQLNTVQDEILQWSTRNFGAVTNGQFCLDNEAKCRLYLVVQLLVNTGEMCHVLLKSAQGIRGEQSEHLVAYNQCIETIEDAMQNYRLGYFDELVATLPGCALGTPAIPPTVRISSLLGVAEELGELWQALLRHDIAETQDAIGDLLVFLLDFCGRNMLSSGDILAGTWATVRQRDWTKNKDNGNGNDNGGVNAEVAAQPTPEV